LASERIAILTDSGCDTPDDFVKAHDVRVVPLGINYSDGSHYRAGIDITSEEVIARLDEEVPTTSLPSPEDLMKTFEQVRDEGFDAAVFVGISSGLSATVDTARLVASHVEGLKTLVIDSLSIGAAAGMLTMSAVEMVEAGIPFEELGARLEELAHRSHVFFCVKDLTWLHKGGRIDEFTYRLGSMLNVKPIIWCDEEGHYRTYKKPRGWDRALSQEFACIKAFAAGEPGVRIAIACTSAADHFEELSARVRSEIANTTQLICSGISAALVVHTGPELVGMGVMPDWRMMTQARA
jgi:DegV family protein with EDD domain